MVVAINIFSLLLEAMMDSLFFSLLKAMAMVVMDAIMEFKFIILIDFKDYVYDL